MQSDGNSFWAALTLNMGRKNAFEAKNMKSKYFGDLFTNIVNTAHNIKELIKLGFSATVVLLCIFEKC